MTLAQNRRVMWFERTALCLSLMYFCLHSLPRAWRTLNTDFPNYYMSARLVHDGYDTSRMYEWPWIEREKDHRALDIRVIGLLPITPFSTLVIWPLAAFAPLIAKHIWILLNLGFLIPIAWMLRSMTGLTYQQVALAFSLSFPLYRNLQFGQFYVFLLLLIVAACWSYLRGYRAVAGALVAIATACKIFPILLFVFFLQRKDWRALSSGILTGLSAIVVSIAVFGLSAHRTWFEEILPWVMHGEGLQPYSTTASISGVLHCLLLSEPQWNPHPWHYSPLLYSLLAPVLQMLALAPAILLIRRSDSSENRVLLEWSALLSASLVISTIPASYNFVLMVFPFCVLVAMLLQRKEYGWLTVLIFSYLGIGFPMPNPQNISGLRLLLYIPRLPLMLVFLFIIYALLWRDQLTKESSPSWTRYAWAAAMLTSVILNTHSTLHLERAEREEYKYRVPLNSQGFLNAEPQATKTTVYFSAFTLNGYHLMMKNRNSTWSDPKNITHDDLSFTARGEHIWVEQASSDGSQIVDLQKPSRIVVSDARDPILSADGQSLAFIRDDHGRGHMMLRRAFQSNAAEDISLTSHQLNVYESSFISEKDYAFSAVEDEEHPQIYLINTTQTNSLIRIADSRYPALSPDGQWLAYSHLEHGVWNLWLLNKMTGATHRIADLPCNQIQPSWENDSKTLLYGTDCGRSVWFTAVARRKVIP